MKTFMEPAEVRRASHHLVLFASVTPGFAVRNASEFCMAPSLYDVYDV